MEEGTRGAGDAVGFHRDIGESAGSDDVARSVLHVHRDGYVLRGLCQQAVDAQEVILKCTQIHVADEELGAILVGVAGKDTEQLRGCDSGLGSGSDGCSSAVLIRLVYDRHKMVVAREERTGYGVGKIFINGGILRGAEGEGVVGIEVSQREAVHACLKG